MSSGDYLSQIGRQPPRPANKPAKLRKAEMELHAWREPGARCHGVESPPRSRLSIDAFSLREPEATSLENALARRFCVHVRIAQFAAPPDRPCNQNGDRAERRSEQIHQVAIKAEMRHAENHRCRIHAEDQLA